MVRITQNNLPPVLPRLVIPFKPIVRRTQHSQVDTRQMKKKNMYRNTRQNYQSTENDNTVFAEFDLVSE